MISLRILNRRASFVFIAAALVLATAAPGLVSAATITGRSIALSSSTKSATNVNYEVEFTAKTASTDAFIVDFCTTAAIATACTAPTDFTAASVGTSGSDTVSDVDANTVKVVLATPAGVDEAVNVVLTGITNPSVTGAMYARIVTYDTSLAADSYTSANPGTHFDEGSVALSITDGFGVSGAVLETMTFCASSTAIAQADCSDATTPPNVVLGAGGVLTTTASTGVVYTQISTNAASGAVVNLKSGASGCGGLVRQGASSNAAGCGITPLTTGVATIVDNSAKFGVKLGALSATTGTVQGVGSYNTTDFYMGYDNVDESEGVTSPYGDPIYNTNSAPVNVGKASLTFGANISNVTPAGNYSANLNLIATGTF